MKKEHILCKLDEEEKESLKQTIDEYMEEMLKFEQD